MKGLFFVIDGGDGSGKATQTKLLADRLAAESMPVRTFAFPRYETPTGRLVKAYLRGEFGDPTAFNVKAASALYAADRLAAADEIRGALDSGTHVIADRYVAANMGHQGSKIADPAERAAYFAWNDEYEYVRNGIPRPDLNVILHVPAATSMRLIAERGRAADGHETLAHLRMAESTYLQIARTFDGFALIECADADGSMLPVDAIHEKVWELVAARLRSRQ